MPSMTDSLLRDLMKVRGFKDAHQTTLAAACGVTQPHISRVLRGKRQLTKDMAKRLAVALGVTATEVRALVGGRQ